MNNKFICLLLISILSACTQKSTNSFNLIKPAIAFKIDETDLIPEGITYDSKANRFFLSSIHKEKVIAINTDGSCFDFIESGQDSILGSLGMKVDADRRRLWTLSNKLYQNHKVSMVHIFDADNGSLIKRFYGPTDKHHLFNDLVISNDGGAYITDTQAGLFFTVPPDLSELQLFLSDTLLTSPNGITISPDNSTLYIADDKNGILITDITNRTVKPIKNAMKVATNGIDGLVYYKNSLLGIVNDQGDYEYIARYQLSKDGNEILCATIIDINNTDFFTPTTAVIVDDNLYLLASTSLGIYLQYGISGKNYFKEPLVLKYKLN